MRIIRYIIFAIYLCLAIYAAIASGINYVRGEFNPTTTEILFPTFCVLATFGILALLATLFLRAIANIMEMLFFGFCTGIILTNTVYNILSGSCYNLDYLIGYGVMVVMLILCVTACYLIHVDTKKKYSIREQMHPSDKENGEESTPTAAGQ